MLNLICLILSAPLGYLGAAMRRNLPGTGWLDSMPDPVAVLRRMHAGLRIRDLRGVFVHMAVLDALTAPLRLRRATGQHTAQLGLVFDPNAGRLRHTETGPMEIPAQYLETRWDATTVFPVDRAPEHAGRTR